MRRREKRYFLFIVPLLGVCLLANQAATCGQKGPLVLPEQAELPQPARPAA